MSNRVVHFEIPSDQPEKSMAFFTSVFGWQFQQFGNEEYWLIQTGDESQPGINGGLMKKKDPRQPVAFAIDVANIDESLERVQQAGGIVVLPKSPIPGVGWMAYFTDPDGTIHGIHQSDPTATM